MSTQSTFSDFTSDGLPARVNGWRLASDRDGFRYLPGSPLDSRIYYVGVVPDGEEVLLIAHTGTESVSIVPAGWCAGGDHLYQSDEIEPIDAAIALMEDRRPGEVATDA